ncbi:MAG: hypothetical protein KGM15_12040 [Pseudomonadota bacterium]|nr:hypothetical protein [Pseudomonadota bacterium]
MENASPPDAALVGLARELIAKIRANGHDVHIDAGHLGFLLSVAKPTAEPGNVRGRDLPSSALGVDLTPYEAIFASADCDRIFAAALQGEA